MGNPIFAVNRRRLFIVLWLTTLLYGARPGGAQTLVYSPTDILVDHLVDLAVHRKDTTKTLSLFFRKAALEDIANVYQAFSPNLKDQEKLELFRILMGRKDMDCGVLAEWSPRMADLYWVRKNIFPLLLSLGGDDCVKTIVQLESAGNIQEADLTAYYQRVGDPLARAALQRLKNPYLSEPGDASIATPSTGIHDGHRSRNSGRNATHVEQALARAFVRSNDVAEQESILSAMDPMIFNALDARWVHQIMDKITQSRSYLMVVDVLSLLQLQGYRYSSPDWEKGLSPYLLSLPFDEDKWVRHKKAQSFYVLREPEGLSYFMETLAKADDWTRRDLLLMVRIDYQNHRYSYKQSKGDGYEKALRELLLSRFPQEKNTTVRAAMLQCLQINSADHPEVLTAIQKFYGSNSELTKEEIDSLVGFRGKELLPIILGCVRHHGPGGSVVQALKNMNDPEIKKSMMEILRLPLTDVAQTRWKKPGPGTMEALHECLGGLSLEKLESDRVRKEPYETKIRILESLRYDIKELDEESSKILLECYISAPSERIEDRLKGFMETFWNRTISDSLKDHCQKHLDGPKIEGAVELIARRRERRDIPFLKECLNSKRKTVVSLAESALRSMGVEGN